MTPRDFVLTMRREHGARLSTGRRTDRQCDWTDGVERCTADVDAVLLFADDDGRPMILALCEDHGRAIEAEDKRITDSPMALATDE